MAGGWIDAATEEQRFKAVALRVIRLTRDKLEVQRTRTNEERVAAGTCPQVHLPRIEIRVLVHEISTDRGKRTVAALDELMFSVMAVETNHTVKLTPSNDDVEPVHLARIRHGFQHAAAELIFERIEIQRDRPREGHYGRDIQPRLRSIYMRRWRSSG